MPFRVSGPAGRLALGVSCLAVPFAVTTVHAQAAPVAIEQAAQPLGSALTQLALRTGVLVGADAELVRGKQAAALSGSYTPEQALRALLAGTGLVAERKAENSYTLRSATPAEATNPVPAPASAAVPVAAAGGAVSTLSEVRVKASANRDEASEGTGAYTVDATRSATKLDLSLRETPQSVTVITQQRMEDQGITQIADVFRQAPGINFVQNGSQGTDSNSVYARGFEIENYLIDGIPQYSSWMSQTGDLAPYDRIEIVRGATGLLSGSGSPAAAINMVRKRPLKAFGGSVQLTAGSWQYYRAEADVSTPLNASGSVRGRVLAALQDNNSWIDRLKEKKKVFYGIVEADLTPDTRLSAGLEYQKHDAYESARNGLPLFFSDGTETQFPRNASAAASWADSHQRQEQVFLSLDHQFAGGWQLRANANQARRLYDDVVGYALNGFPDRATGEGLGLWANRWNSEPKQNALDVFASGPFQLFGRKHELVLGYNVSRTTYTAPGYAGWPRDLGTIPNIFTWDGNTPAQPVLPHTGNYDFKETQSGLYATVRLRPTDSLSVILGARRSNWEQTYDSYPFDDVASHSARSENGVITPYAGVVYDLSRNWSVYASYTDIFKPSRNQDITGNYLEPETGKAYEAGAKASFLDDKLNLSFAVFEVQQDNLPVWTSDVVPTTGESAYRAEKGTKTRGWEAEIEGEIAPGLQIGASYSIAEPKDKDGQRLNTQVPKEMLKLFSTYRIAGIGNGLAVGGNLNWQSAIYNDAAGPNYDQRFTQGSYSVLDLMARYPITDRLTASLHVYNVFDQRYYTSVSSSYFGTPRSAQATLQYRF